MFLSKLIDLFKSKPEVKQSPLVNKPIQRNRYGYPGLSYHHMPNKPNKYKV